MEPLEPTEPVNPWKTTSGFAECTPAHQATVVLLNVPLRINHHPFILFLSLCPRSSFHLVSLQLVSHSFVAQHSFPSSSFHLVSQNPFVLSLITLYLVILRPIILSPIIRASPTTESSWVESLEEGRYNVLVPHQFVSHHALIWSSDLSPFILLPFILPPIVFSPHHPFMLSRCILFPFLCLPSMCLSSLPFISFRYLFILPAITPSSCLRSRCLALFCLPLSLHLVSHYPFILSLSIPPSCPIILSLPTFFDHVLSVVKSLLTFVAVGLQSWVV